MENYVNLIEDYWQKFNNDASALKNDTALADLKNIINMVGTNKLKVVEKKDGEWFTNEWVKMAICLYIYNKKSKITGVNNVNGYSSGWFDKIEGKFSSWSQDDFIASQIRAVPGSYVREGSFIDKSVVLMPCFVNIGASIGQGTMIDTWSTIGSCAYIGKNCHISGGVGIGGVLEPIQAAPVIIEDNVFIGARSEVAEGVIIGEGSVISMGVFLGASTKIVNRETGEIFYNRIPPYSVVVPGSMKTTSSALNEAALALNCAVIIKTVDESTRKKTRINDLLRI